MTISKKYTLDYLMSLKRDLNTRSRNKMIPFTVHNRLISLFPVSEEKFSSKNNPWAFQCICGDYCVQDGGAVLRGVNKSCGCLRKAKGRLEGIWNMYKLLLVQDTYTLLKIGSGTKVRDWGFRCNVCGIESFNLSQHEVLRENVKFCRCSSNYVCNSVEAKEELLEGIVDTTWKLNFWDEDNFTTKSNFYVTLECKVCGDIKPMLYSNAFKKGCYSCANLATSKRLKKDTGWFIKEARKVHGDRYDYSLVDYVDAKTHVNIICHAHEEPYIFSQSPDNHKNKGKGCNECKRLRLRYVHFHLSRAEDHKEEYEKLPSGVYLLRLEEGLYKIGLSKDVYKRSLEIDRASPFKTKAEVLAYKQLNLYEGLHLEHNLHVLFKEYNEVFDILWDGHSECFRLSGKQVQEVMDIIERGKV